MTHLQEQIPTKTALAQSTTTTTITTPRPTADNTFSINGAISSLVLGRHQKLKLLIWGISIWYVEPK